MTIHTCRDFLTLTSAFPTASMYVASCFMIGVLNFTQVGHTNFNVSSSLRVSSGVNGSINFGVTGSYSTVEIPGASHTVSASDVNRILALRSTLNPRHNSGLFRISSVLTASNRLNIEYRSSEDPPAETNTLIWSIFTAENAIGGPVVTGGATPTGASGYKSSGAYVGKRIILQSPHSSSWQVRMCYESSTDRTNHTVECSIAPGFGGDANGDFPSGSYDNSNLKEHLHGPLWFDVSNSNYRGTTVGLEMAAENAAASVRYYAWGDDVSGSCCFVVRNVSNHSDGWYSFGMSEEDAELPPRTSQRLFVFGQSTRTSQDVRWDNGMRLNAKFTGVAFGLTQKPQSCIWAPYSYISSMASTGIKAEAIASDNALLNATELQKVDLWAGTSNSGANEQTFDKVYDFDPRRLGSMPLARLGRSNFSTWSLTTDKTWFHSKNGVYFLWEGPALYS